MFARRTLWVLLLLSSGLVSCGGAAAPTETPRTSGSTEKREYESKKAEDGQGSEKVEKKRESADGEQCPIDEDNSDPIVEEKADAGGKKTKKTTDAMKAIEVQAPQEQDDAGRAEASPATITSGESGDAQGGDGTGWAIKRGKRRAEDAIRRINSLLKDYGGTLQRNDLDLSLGACPGTCKLAEAICESAGVICDVAKNYTSEMNRDCDWASSECDSANTLCTACSQERQ